MTPVQLVTGKHISKPAPKHEKGCHGGKMITVMGATGHTGRKIAEALLKTDEKVRALGRSENKLAELKKSGAEVLAGDTTDAAFLTKAFEGADAVYTLLPTDRRSSDYLAQQDREGEAILTAIRQTGSGTLCC